MMGAFRVTRRKVSRTFRQMPRRASPMRRATPSAPRATAPIAAFTTSLPAKAGTKDAYGGALATSLVIHAGFALGCFFWATAPDATPVRSAIPVDILTEPAALRPIEVKPAPAVARSTRPRSRPRLSAQVRLALPAPVEVEHLDAAPPAPPAAASSVAEPIPGPLAAATAADSPTGTVAVGPTAPSGPPAVVAPAATDTSAVGEIVRRLRSAAASCYPYAAVRSNLEGTTRLRFCIGAKGEPRTVEVVNSSGSALLDGAAVDCVLPSAMPFPAISRPCVTVPVRFELQR